MGKGLAYLDFLENLQKGKIYAYFTFFIDFFVFFPWLCWVGNLFKKPPILGLFLVVLGWQPFLISAILAGF